MRPLGVGGERRGRKVLADEGGLGEEGDALQLAVVGSIDDGLDGALKNNWCMYLSYYCL